MTALALLAQDLLGTGTQVFGAAVGPTTPTATLAVFVGAGRIYSMAALEPSAWSSLAADATQILKQGILDTAGITIPCPVLGTSGQSVNYLIEGQFQENDITPQVLSYYNSSNPALPWSGAGNLGIAQPTVRAGQFKVQAKAGTPATTGSQTTPTVDAGWIALAVVTVAFGATTITAGNITQLAGNSGSFLMTYVGGATAPTGLAYYSMTGPLVSLVIPPLSATSNSTGFSYSGLPAFLQPAAFAGANNQLIALPFGTNNSAAVSGAYAILANGSASVQFGLNGVTSGWTASGTKGAAGAFTYRLF